MNINRTFPTFIAVLMISAFAVAAPPEFKSRADQPPRKAVICTTMFDFRGTLAERVQQAEKLIDDGAETVRAKYPGKGLDLVVFREHAIRNEGDTAAKRAISVKDPALAQLSAKARQYKTYLLVPLINRETEGGVCTNAAVLFDREGKIVGLYRKFFPHANPEGVLEGGITPGTDFPVFQTDFGKIGALICWDMGYVEGWQTLADAGAELVVVPSASPQTIRPAAAALKHCYHVVTSTPRDNATFFNPIGVTIAQTTEEAVLVHEIDFSYAILHWTPALENGAGLTKLFGDKVGYNYSSREDTGVFWSNDPQMTIGAMIGKLGVREFPVELERSRDLATGPTRLGRPIPSLMAAGNKLMPFDANHPAFTTPPGTPPEPALEKRAQAILSQMTLEEKAGLMAGTDDWHIRGVPRLGVPPVRVTDCGHGVTLCGDRSSPATCFPTGIGMAATWNPDLMEKTGEVIGRETRALGCSLMLGPMINLHRIPINGRSFETFSEDPVLAGRLGAAIIRGIQSQGVGACVKSVTANNQQKHQDKVSVEADERTIRELYMRAFEIAVREGRPAAIMTAYNALNGKPTSESFWLLTEVIKHEWQYSGFIVSDWRAVKSSEAFTAGLDLEMPGPGKFLNPAGVLRALETGLLSPAELDDRVSRLLRFLLQFGKAEDAPVDLAAMLDTPGHRACAQAVAEEAIVLLKNDGAILPLDRTKLRRIAVVGPNAAAARLGGGGSASVTPFYSVSPLEGIQAFVGKDVAIDYAEGIGLVGKMAVATGLQYRGADGVVQPGARMQIFNDPKNPVTAALDKIVPQIDFSWGWAAPGPGALRTNYLARFTAEIVAPADGEFTLGLYGQEGDVRLWLDNKLIIDEWDDSPAANFEAGYAIRYPMIAVRLTQGRPVPLQIEYRKRAARGAVRFEWEQAGAGAPWKHTLELARRADVTIVCAGLSNLFEGGSRDRTTIDLPETQIEFIKAIVAANPRTVLVLNNGGPVSMPWLNQVPAVLEAWYPGQAGGAALARILFGDVNPSGKLPDSFPHRLEDLPATANYPGDGKHVHYREGLKVGYRFYDTADKKPLFPFGYGLSYTTFKFEDLKLSAKTLAPGGTLQASVRITNTGTRSGRETVQLYVRDVASSIERPAKELRHFAKVELAAGETRTVTLTVGWDDLAFFHPDRRQWLVETGEFQILVGPDSQQLLSAAFTVP